ncbi:hypothetical protein ACHAWF_002801 [Thalassiosira exigua]
MSPLPAATTDAASTDALAAAPSVLESPPSPGAGGSRSSSHGLGASSGSGSGAGGPTPFALAHHESLEWAPSSNRQSSDLRHRTDYARLRTLGRGAFGTTHLVKNVIDARLYALKQIRLGKGETVGTEASKRVLREVDALSALRSENVVRYFAAWVERGEIDEGANSDGDSDSRFLYASTDCTGGSTAATGIDDADRNPQTSLCNCNLCHRNYADWEISYEQWGLIDAVLQPLNLCTDCYVQSLPDHIDAAAIDIRRKNAMPECLYILMEYAGDTLSDVMRTLNDDDDAKRWRLFAQCVQGLYSIHEAGYFHRDIKSTNIFVKDDVAKIGDLGFAFPNAEDLSPTSSDGGSVDVGTLLYSAPEVGEGRYEKADIYSLGVVLVELFGNFATGMERVVVLSKIREGECDIPRNADFAELARWMVKIRPEERPCARQVLEHLVQEGRLESPDPSVLLQVVKQQRKQMDKLERELMDKDKELGRLRRLLETPTTSRTCC